MLVEGESEEVDYQTSISGGFQRKNVGGEGRIKLSEEYHPNQWILQ